MRPLVSFTALSALRPQPSVLGGLAASAGQSAEQIGDSETGESASLLAKESGAEAPAQEPGAALILAFCLISAFQLFLVLSMYIHVI